MCRCEHPEYGVIVQCPYAFADADVQVNVILLDCNTRLYLHSDSVGVVDFCTQELFLYS